MNYTQTTQTLTGTYVALAQHVADVLRACPHFPDDFRADGARVANTVATAFGEIFPLEVLAANAELTIYFIVTHKEDDEKLNGGNPGWIIERLGDFPGQVIVDAGTSFDKPNSEDVWSM